MNRADRRTFLCGGGATMMLPFLPSLVGADSGETRRPAMKLVIMYLPNGIVRRCFFPGEEEGPIPGFVGGFNADKLLKDKRRRNSTGVFPLKLTETLQPLAGQAGDITLVTGLDRSFKNGQDVHAQGASCYLTSVSPEQAAEKGWRYPNGRSLDQVIGDEVGKDCVYRTLEISTNGYRSPKEDIYFDNISWYGPGQIAPSIKEPRKLYKRLFMAQSFREHVGNVTDLVLEDARDLRLILGKEDRSTLDEFMTSVRDLELRVDRLDKLAASAEVAAPGSDILPRGDYIRLMADLMIAALRMDLTNVSTFMIGPERWSAPLLYEGVFDKPQDHHSLSHNQFGDGYKKLQKIDAFHMGQLAYVIDRMKAVKLVDGTSLLENTVLTCGAGLGDGATHQFFDLPMIVAGGGQGKLKQGRMVATKNGTPHTNLWLTVAQLMGLEIDTFADSKGLVSELWT